MSDKLKIIVLGAVGQIPFAGMAWEALHYLEGFRRLGHDVYYVEDTGSWPYDPVEDGSSQNCRNAVHYLARVMEWGGFSGRWAYRAPEPDDSVFGLSESCFAELFRQADVLINWAAATRLHDRHLSVPVRVFLQTDPGGGEILAAQGDPGTIELLSAHTHFFNWAENLGAPECQLPAEPFSYCLTRMPVVLDWFTPPAGLSFRPARPPQVRFTTMANWYQPGEVEWKGEVYHWSKHHQFLKFIDLPKRIDQPLELALGSIDEEAVELLVANQWKVVEAAPIGTEIEPFRDYIFGSDAEFTVAKDQYVRLRTGWFSDRSSYYLTAGKPVITQNTGFGRVLPTGEGLFSFDTVEEVVTACEAIQSDYSRHAKAARAIAEEYFRAETVLAKLLNDLQL